MPVPKISKLLSEQLMLAALQEAKEAFRQNEVPVGAVIFHDGQIIARAHNLVECSKDCSAHAEILAIREAARILGDWRLNECVLAVTLEPCTMCLGAIKLSRISQVVIGLMDPARGACGSLFDLSQDSRLGPEINLISGVMASESEQILQEFFREKRR